MTLERELLEERAAIIADGEKCTQWLAGELAAKQMGYRGYYDALAKTSVPVSDGTEGRGS